jgi:hypothetical protein
LDEGVAAASADGDPDDEDDDGNVDEGATAAADCVVGEPEVVLSPAEGLGGVLGASPVGVIEIGVVITVSVVKVWVAVLVDNVELGAFAPLITNFGLALPESPNKTMI